MKCRLCPYVFFIHTYHDIVLIEHHFQVIVTADLTKSPPVIKVYSVNPYAQK